MSRQRRHLGRAALAVAAVALGLVPALRNGSTATPIGPGFSTFVAPASMGRDAGEPSIGINWNTGNALFQSGLETLRVSFDDSTTPTKATWTDVSPVTSATTMDPILFTDPATGRTVVSQLVSSLVVPGGGCSLSSTTDDDGATWLPSTGCGAPGTYDHQTVGGGPFRDPTKAAAYPHSMYYCGQNGYFANCAASFDGGHTYGAGVPLYTDPDTAVTDTCIGLHGHVKVAPDGTVYVPNFSCNADGQQSVVVSVDDGLTWKVRALPEAPYNGFKSDPTVGIGADGTVYYAYEGVDGPLRVAVSRDKGVTWTKPVDLTGLAGLAYGVMPAAVAGDGDRAAVAFIGTADTGTSDDMYEDKDYKGVWHLYVAMTYDRGATWEVVNTTPADPVQRGCIWWGNGTCPSVQRNLLDFIDAQIDSSGRVVVAYADGCIGACVNKAPNTAEDIATIARQSAGRTLFAAKDPPPPTP